MTKTDLVNYMAEETGMTKADATRALEAMLCHRKLITNNKSIVKEDFYNPQNIFIIGVDDNQNVKDFIDSDFVVGDESILKKYDFNNWLNSFIEN